MLTKRFAIIFLCACTASACGKDSAPRQGERAQPSTQRAQASSSPAASEAPSVQGPLHSQEPRKQQEELIELSGAQLIERVQRSGKRAVIINAWASWCGPCRREMPMLLALKTNLEPRGIGVELISVDDEQSRPQAIEFLKQHGAELPSYIAERPLGPFKAALNPNWPGMLPASFLFDAAGRLRYFWGGPVYENELLDIVDQFLAGTLVDGQARFGLAPGKVEH